MNNLRVRSKVWLEIDGMPFLGDGRYQLLAAIHRSGSINAASRELGISYRKAWAQLQAMEEIAPFSLLEKQTGGKNGGSTRLTLVGLELMGKFEKIRASVNTEADRCFEICFQGIEAAKDD